MNTIFKVGDKVYFEDKPQILEILEVSGNPRTKTPYRIKDNPYWASECQLLSAGLSDPEAKSTTIKMFAIEHKVFGLLGVLDDSGNLYFVPSDHPHLAELFFTRDQAEEFLDNLCLASSIFKMASKFLAVKVCSVELDDLLKSAERRDQSLP